MEDNSEALTYWEADLGEATEQSEPSCPAVLDVGLLIETIQNYEFLYDLSNKDYKNTKKKALAWQEISEVLNASVEDCMKMWKNIRDRFVREKNKSRSGSEAEPTWAYFNAMLFYNKCIKKRTSYTSAVQTKKAKIQTSSGPSSRPSSAASVWSTMDSIVSSPETPQPQQVFSEEDVTPSTSKGRKNKKNTEIEEILGTAKELCSSMKVRHLEEAGKANANKRFTDYVYSRLEEMEVQEAVAKRKKMLAILEDL